LFYNLAGIEKSTMATSKTGNTNILACRQDRNEKSLTAIAMFSKSRYSMGLSKMLHALTGNGKYKMTSFKPELLISYLAHNIGMKFQRIYLCFVFEASHSMGLSRV